MGWPNPSTANDPHLDAQYIKLLAFVTQWFIAKRITLRAVADIQRIIQPQTIVTATRANAQKAHLTVDVAIVEAAVGEGLETDGLAGRARRWGRRRVAWRRG